MKSDDDYVEAQDAEEIDMHDAIGRARTLRRDALCLLDTEGDLDVVGVQFFSLAIDALSQAETFFKMARLHKKKKSETR